MENFKNDKKQQTDLTAEEIELMALDNVQLRKELESLRGKLKQMETNFLNQVDKVEGSANSLTVPIEKQINWKQTQILRDKSHENEALLLRVQQLNDQIEKMKIGFEQDLKELKSQFMQKERQYEEVLAKNQLEMQQMEEEFKALQEEQKDRFSVTENQELTKLREEHKKNGEIVEIIEKRQLGHLEKLEKIEQEKRYQDLRKLIEEMKDLNRKKSSLLDFSIIEREGVSFLEGTLFEKNDMENLKRQLENEGKEAVENLQATMTQKKLEMFSSQNE